ncbi:hypothetical protein GCM10029964_052700 [Kibdelosporangium lantanae]
MSGTAAERQLSLGRAGGVAIARGAPDHGPDTTPITAMPIAATQTRRTGQWALALLPLVLRPVHCWFVAAVQA